MDQCGNYPAPLDAVLLVATMVLLSVTLEGLWTAWAVEATIPVARIMVTQRGRYGWALLAQLAAAVAVLWPIVQFGGGDTFVALDAWRQHAPLLGWIMTVAYWAGIVSPVLTLLTVISVHRQPAKAGKRVRGGYVLTEHVKLPDPPVVRPFAAFDGSGRLRRYWTDHV